MFENMIVLLILLIYKSFLLYFDNLLRKNNWKNFKSKIYDKLTTSKLIILSFRLYLCSYSMDFFVWYCLFDEFCYINTDCRLVKFLIAVKFTIKIHMVLEKYIKITVFLLKMKYLRNIWMFDNDFLASGMLIRNNLLLVYLKKCLIFMITYGLISLF